MNNSTINIGDFCQLEDGYVFPIDISKLDILIVVDITRSQIRPGELRVKFYNITQNKKHIHEYNAAIFTKL